MTKELTCAQRLDNAFNAAEKSYKLIFNGVESGKYEQFIETSEIGLIDVKNPSINYRDIQNVPPTSYLNELKRRWRQSGEFKAEIEHHWIDEKVDYFNHLRYKMTKHYNFIIENCMDGVDFYRLNFERSHNLIYRINHTGTALTKNELLSAMQLAFVDLFIAFENVIIQNYTGYSRLLNTTSDSVNRPAYDYIHLKYGESNSEVITKLYGVFLGKFIDIDLNAFKAHFRPASEAIPKMKWKSSQSLLCTVFSGVILTEKNTPVPNIQTNAVDLPKMIAEHFCYSNGKDFDVEVLRSTINKLGKKAVRYINQLLPTLQEIEKSYKVL